MAAPVALYRTAANQVAIGGTPVIAIYGGAAGGFVTNPATAADQGIAVIEALYVDIVNPATLGESATTIPIQPGQTYVLPPGQTTNLSVNAATSGHKFSGLVIQSPTSFPPVPPPGPFPPSGPTSLGTIIPSYLYKQYDDDQDLQAFVGSYNAIAQAYLDWFNTVGLPVYTSPQIVSLLLDWIALGLYGTPRPSLSSGRNRNLGPINTYAPNVLTPNQRKVIGPQNVTATSDDVYKRILTWSLYKGDGKYFTITWLKRRIMRFLIGVNGTGPNIDQTYQVSVSFGLNNQVNITLVTGKRTVLGGAILNGFAPNQKTPNQLDTTFKTTAPLPNAAILKEAIDSGVLDLPFQFTYVVTAA